MTKDEVAEKVQDIIAKSLGLERDKVKPEASFITDLRADSLDVAEMVLAMEKEFGISMPDEDARKIKTIQDVIDYVASRVP